MASRFTLAIALIAIFLLSVFAKKEENKKEDVVRGSSRIDGPIIGIDLGTTYSCVAIYRNNKTEIIPDEFGNRITASVVSFTEKGDRLVGEAAKNNAVYNPRNTFYDVKRLIGRRYSEILEKDAKLFSYEIVDKNDKPYIKVQRSKDGDVELLAPEEISAMVLQKMKSIAEKYLGQPVKYAVITVPAYFNDQQRQATADAGKIAGLEVKRIVNEPTAASMAYGLYKSKEHNILVFDLGGGTFDVSLLRIDNGLFEVVATAGDTRLGGEDFDLRVVDYFVKEFKKEHGKNLKDSKQAFQKLKLAVERAKRELSSQTETIIEIDSLMDGIDFSKRFSRALFEKINGDLFKKTLEPVKQVLSDAGLSKSDIDEIVLVGGSTRIPKVRDLLSEFFGGKKLNMEVNPDEAVADGAAVQGGVLSGATEQSGHEVILVDVTPLSLGVETQGGIMSVIIPRNTPIPCDKAETYTTTENYQSKLSIPIYEGERKQAKFNRLLGTLELDNIPPAPRGVPKIKIQFQLNQDGILKVIATDEGTGNKREITIRKGTFSDKEIDRMKKDAEKNAEEDAKIVEKVEARHKLERFIEQTSAQLQSEVASKLDKDAVSKLQKALKEKSAWVRKNFESAEKSEFKKQLKELKKLAGQTFAKLYGDDPKLAVGEDDDDDDEDKPKNEEEIDPEIADEDRPISQRKQRDEL